MIYLSISDQIQFLIYPSQRHMPEKVIKITDMLIVTIGK